MEEEEKATHAKALALLLCNYMLENNIELDNGALEIISKTMFMLVAGIHATIEEKEKCASTSE